MPVPDHLVQSILNDFAQTKLCSYQIACKHDLYQNQVVSIIKANLGSEAFSSKEERALYFLYEQMLELQKKQVSVNEICSRLLIRKNTYYHVIEIFSKVPASSEILQISSIDDLDKAPVSQNSQSLQNSAADEQNTEVPAEGLHPVVTEYRPRHNYYSQGYSRRSYYHRRPYQEHYYNPSIVRLNIRGIQISFDTSKVPDALIGKIISCINQA